MISLINGQVVSNKDGQVVVKTTGGVGYLVFASLSGLKEWVVGKEAEVLTYLSVRENALDLFGFTTEAERGLFKKLLDVSGIGPKSALHILSLGSVGDISAAINRGDVGYLTQVSGIGKKTAERIAVELKNKLADLGVVDDGGPVGDAVAGLVSLGYSATDARVVVKGLNPSGKSSEALLKEALQKIK